MVHLGSVFDCDWEGIPKIHQHLVPTTYKVPPFTTTYLEDGTPSPSIETQCGMTSTGKNGESGLFFDVDCIGLQVGSVNKLSFPPTTPNSFPRCNNFKRVCEMGVTLDVAQFSGGNVIVNSDCKITDQEIAQPWGGLFRDVFYTLNSGSGPSKLDSWPSTGLPTGLNTGFDVQPSHYTAFRRNGANNSYNTINPTTGDYQQPDNSYYFYFGSMPGRSAIDLMNSKFFPNCPVIEKNSFIVQVNSPTYSGGSGYNTSSPTACDGSINITVVGGSGTFNYAWSGPFGYTNSQNTPQSGDIYGLCAGVYNVTVTDLVDGGSSTTTITLYPPASLSCTLTTTPAAIPGGFATINLTIGGGLPPISYTVSPQPPNIPVGPTVMTGTFEQIPVPAGVYTVTVIDGSNANCVTNGVTATTVPVVNLQNFVTSTDTTCGNVNGTITMALPPASSLGGQPPYSFSIVGPSPSNLIVSSSTNATGLASGTYRFVVTDATYTGGTSPFLYNTGGIDDRTLLIAPSLTPSFSLVIEDYCWIDGNVPQIFPTFNNIVATGAFTISWTDKNSNAPTPPILGTTPLIGAGTTTYTLTQLLNPITYDFLLTDAMGCKSTIVDDFSAGQGLVPSYASKITWVQEKYCWANNGNADILPRLTVTSEKGGLVNWKAGTTIVHSQPFGGGINVNVVPSVFLQAGTYTFEIVDNASPNSCITTSVSVNLNVGGPWVPSARLSGIINQTVNTRDNFNNPQTGSATVTPAGGWAPYTYQWSNGQTNQNITLNPSEFGNSLTCTITDSEGCQRVTNPIIVT